MSLTETMSEASLSTESTRPERRILRRATELLVMAAALIACGCATNKSAAPIPPSTANTSVPPSANSGVVQTGQLPIIGATIQMYAVGAAGDGSPATPLLTSSVLSDTSGAFSLIGLYKCPSSSTNVYLTASGGTIGGAANAQSILMAAVGPCGNLTPNSFISVNEVTTVAAVAALAPYLSSYEDVGSGATDAQNMSDAFSMAAELANFTTGSTPGTNVPAGQVVPSQKLNSLANILSACIHSAGGKAGDGSPCGLLFSLASASNESFPTDTVAALLNIADNPTNNVVPIYDLNPSPAPYGPGLTTAPSDWSLGMNPSMPVSGTVPVPTLSPVPGSISASTSIALSDSDPSAIMYYSTDGSLPTSSSTRYTGAFLLSRTSTVRAVAIAGSVSSLLAAGTYIVTSDAAPAPAISLAFTASPTNVTVGTVISPALQVEVKDQAGNADQSYANQVTIGIANASTTSVLGGTLSEPVINGVATFSDLTITQPGSSYQFTASSPGAMGALSTVFTASAPTAAPPITIQVAPATANIAPSQTATFAATFSDGSSSPVIWSINPATGSISAAGVYTAPATVSSPSTVTVTATSTSNPNETASGTVTVNPATGSTYYLSANGSDSNSGLSSSSPWLTPNHALNCGDTILAAPGSGYNATNFASGRWGAVSCSGTTPSTQSVAWLKCATFDSCKLSSSGNGIFVSASNWGVQGWEVTTSASTGGVCFGAQPASSASGIHNIIFANNVANGCGGNGISNYNLGHAGVDYFSIVGNVVYAAAKGSSTCNSGISIYEPIKYDSASGTHIYVAGNILLSNVDPDRCAGTSPTDGEGILFDTFDGSQTSGYVPYTQQAVMTNNITVGNGNSGVKVYQNDVGAAPFAPLYMTHNTTWGNTTATNESGSECAEVMLIATTNTQVSGNLSVTASASSCGGNPLYAYYVVSSPTTTNSINDNWGYSPGGNNGGIGGGSSGFSFGAGNIFGENPLLANPSIPGAPNCSASSSVPNCMATVIANFTPKNSAAKSYGYQKPSTVSTHDALFPKWLCNVTLPSGLVTMGCSN